MLVRDPIEMRHRERDAVKVISSAGGSGILPVAWAEQLAGPPARNGSFRPPSAMGAMLSRRPATNEHAAGEQQTCSSQLSPMRAWQPAVPRIVCEQRPAGVTEERRLVDVPRVVVLIDLLTIR